MKVLVLFECSGRTREAFRRRGIDAWSCDIKPAEDGSPYHLCMDAYRAMWLPGVQLIIAHPPCTYLCSSGLHWNKRVPERKAKTEAALQDVRRLLAAPVPFVCVENPRGCIGTKIRKADQIIQPYEFGDDASKETHLWLRGLPALIKHPDKRRAGRKVIYEGKTRERWGNQTDSGQNRLSPSEGRATERAKTYPGIATAFAENWGPLLS